MSVIAGAAAIPHALNVLPAVAAVAVLCGLVIAEIVALPGVLLPGGTVALLAGALIGSGPPRARGRRPGRRCRHRRGSSGLPHRLRGHRLVAPSPARTRRR